VPEKIRETALAVQERPLHRLNFTAEVRQLQVGTRNWKLPWLLTDLTSLISHELTSLVAGFEDFLSFHPYLSVISQSYDTMKNGPFDPI
jgi:hypothetical protein